MNLTKQDAKFMPMTISVKTNQYNGVASLRDLDLNNIKLAVLHIQITMVKHLILKKVLKF